MEESALAAPAICTNPQHAHALAWNGTRPPTLRQEGGEALALAGIAHDARNLVTAMRLCSDLLAEPGVLAAGHGHYAQEIRSIAEAAGQLVRRLSALARVTVHPQDKTLPIADLGCAVRDLQPLLAAVAGPAISLDVDCRACSGQVRLSEEALTRILMNLVRNAAEAMPSGGNVRLVVQSKGSGTPQLLAPGTEPATGADRNNALLVFEDDGPGIPAELVEHVFEPGVSTRRSDRIWPRVPHRGLGLSIVRQLVGEAGGTVRVAASSPSGTRFEIELPLTKVTADLPSEPAFEVRDQPQ